MRKAVCSVIMTFSLSSIQAFAIPGDGELIEVTGEDLSGSNLPMGLAMLTGWVGASSSPAAATLKQAALEYGKKQALKQRENKDKKDQKSQYDDATKDTSGGAGQEAVKQAGGLLNELFKTGEGVIIEYHRDGDKEDLTIKSCTPSGVLNPKNPCTMQKVEIFTDPTDSMEKYAYTLAVVEAAYNPKHYYADASGYYPKVVDNQSFTLVFENISELAWSLNKLVGK